MGNDPSDGRGGGFGRYPGLTVAEIEDRFALCVSDPSMRSISAVLRVTREQLDARGQLGHYPTYVWIVGSFALLFACAYFFMPPQFIVLVSKGAAGSWIVFIMLLVGSWRVRDARTANLAQERRIREASAAALAAILKHQPELKPLTREQRDTVLDLVKRLNSRADLEPLLGDS